MRANVFSVSIFLCIMSIFGVSGESELEPLFAAIPLDWCLRNISDVAVEHGFIEPPDTLFHFVQMEMRAEKLYKRFQEANKNHTIEVVESISNVKELLACIWIASKNDMILKFRREQIETLFNTLYPDYKPFSAGELSRVERAVLSSLDWRVFRGEVVPHDAGTRRRREGDAL